MELTNRGKMELLKIRGYTVNPETGQCYNPNGKEIAHIQNVIYKNICTSYKGINFKINIMSIIGIILAIILYRKY